MSARSDHAMPAKPGSSQAPPGAARAARAVRPPRLQAEAPVALRVPRAPGAADRARRISGPRIWRILCLCQIDNFSALRRHLGRARAEVLIRDVADRILALCPDVRLTVAGRALLEIGFERDAPEVAADEIDRLCAAFAEPLDIDGEPHQLQLVFGIAAAPAAEEDDVRLAEAAESALEQARAEGRVVLRDLSRADLAFDRLTLMRELPRAIAEGEMFLQYQPKVHVRRQEIASAEALIRWQHPTRGLILPGDFISVAEDAGEIGPLTLWTLRQVIADQRRLAAAGHDFPVFINISGLLLADERFVSEASAIIRESGARIGFEITETSVIRDPESAIRHLRSLAEIGVRLAIDDYGAGLSSLAYLKQLPAAELKIDKMFVLQLTSSNRDPLIVRSTIDLAHALEMEVTAEGVETPSALALLSVMGCDMVQGFLISRPLAIEAFHRFLDEDAHLLSAGTSGASFVMGEGFWKRA
ncbi:putative bifunctional diguanylate cyclase/phosphodiesterase [Sphingosinithalassobacter sp. LHW66-3]|uniref:putative bifunctional diguanylate cyclase/phosphodiesterase n=1 Tax=Sphingosinithalassobacter sp. LHW66-3 TaxID=3424718 RepID=UPI003D6C6B5C